MRIYRRDSSELKFEICVEFGGGGTHSKEARFLVGKRKFEKIILIEFFGRSNKMFSNVRFSLFVDLTKTSVSRSVG